MHRVIQSGKIRGERICPAPFLRLGAPLQSLSQLLSRPSLGSQPDGELTTFQAVHQSCGPGVGPPDREQSHCRGPGRPALQPSVRLGLLVTGPVPPFILDTPPLCSFSVPEIVYSCMESLFSLPVEASAEADLVLPGSLLPPSGHQRSWHQAAQDTQRHGEGPPPWVFGSGRHRRTWNTEVLRTVVGLHNMTPCYGQGPGNPSEPS